jgi:putative restriction endonuclease
MPDVTPRKPWSRTDLLVAMNLYCKLPFGRLHSTTPEIVAVARLMGRTPASLSMKLCNFASMDPALRARGIKGLQNLSRADREVWDEFNSDWSELGLESEKLYQELVSGADPLKDEAKVFHRKGRTRPHIVMPVRPPAGDTESRVSLFVRRGQSFFRKAVLASYNCQCCITGNPIPELLNASHIKPWRGFPGERLNPANGLCLAKTHDAAFDAGLISFDRENRLLVSRYIEDCLPSDAIERDFIAMKGKPLTLPAKFQPEPAFLEFHRSHVFRG